MGFFVSNKSDLLKVQSAFEAAGIDVGDVFKVGMLSEYDLSQLLNVNNDLRTDYNDLVALDEKGNKGATLFSSLDSILKRYDLDWTKVIKSGGAAEVPAYLLSDRRIALRELESNCKIYDSLPVGLKNDREFALLAITQDANVFKYLSSNFKNDRQFVMDAASQNCFVLKFAAPVYQKDQEIAFVAVRSDGNAIEFVDPAIANYWGITQAAVRQNAEALYKVKNGLRTDEDFLFNAALGNINIFSCISDRALSARIWARMIESLHSEGISFPVEMESSFFAFETILKSRYGIEFIECFRSPKTIHELMRVRDAEILDDRPIAIMLYARKRSDPNKALARYPLADRYVANGKHNVFFFEVGDDETLVDILKKIHERTGRNYQTIIWAGHGSGASLALDDASLYGVGSAYIPKLDRDSERSFIDVWDIREGQFDLLKDMLDPEGVIFLHTCLGAQDKGEITLQGDISNELAMRKVDGEKLIPSAVDILAYTESTNIKDMHFSIDGLKPVIQVFDGEVYNAGGKE